MIINEADYLHVAVDEGQRAGRVSIVGLVKHIHSLQRKPKTNFKTIYILLLKDWMVIFRQCWSPLEEKLCIEILEILKFKSLYICEIFFTK